MPWSQQRQSDSTRYRPAQCDTKVFLEEPPHEKAPGRGVESLRIGNTAVRTDAGREHGDIASRGCRLFTTARPARPEEHCFLACPRNILHRVVPQPSIPAILPPARRKGVPCSVRRSRTWAVDPRTTWAAAVDSSAVHLPCPDAPSRSLSILGPLSILINYSLQHCLRWWSPFLASPSVITPALEQRSIDAFDEELSIVIVSIWPIDSALHHAATRST